MRTQTDITQRYNFLGNTGLYDFVVNTFLFGRDPSIRRRLLTASSISAGARVLDVGTGTGRNLPILASLVGEEGHIEAVDISSGMLEPARRRVKTTDPVRIIHTDIFEYQPREAFDVITAAYVFSVVPNPTKLAETLSQMLRPRGKILVLEAGIPEVNSRLFKSILRFEEWIAAADLSVDVPRLMPQTEFLVERKFEFWEYINGFEFKHRRMPAVNLE